MPTTHRRRGISGISLVLALALALGLYVAFQHSAPTFEGSGCTASSGRQAVPLSTGQAGIAATIAGVARRHSMPVRAVTVAYATALQESKLANLHYGDLDSVGIFQQRPSEGWGTTRHLEDPVYATAKFFDALARVPGYRHLPVSQAAQAVQRSADGSAYGQYRWMAARMARAFSGEAPHSVWCWYAGYPGSAARRARLAAVSRELSRTFGPLPLQRAGDPALGVRVADSSAGWAVAAWLVSHATDYKIITVRFAGYQWTAAAGAKGWVRAPAAERRSGPAGTVELS